MLESLHLQNFRGFNDHVVPLRPLTIMVGANNAGKTTVVEALRLVALVVDRFRRSASGYQNVPPWLDHELAFRGIGPAMPGRMSDLQAKSLFFVYGDPPGVITARFTSGGSVNVFVGPDAEVHAVARDSVGHAVANVREAKKIGLHPVAIQPQVAPLLRDEPYRTDETVRRGEGTYLAPQHFRNQLYRASTEELRAFRSLAEESWRGLQIQELTRDENLHLQVRDIDFVGEVSTMGHGLQMWLQTIWFLARAPTEAAVVLDEPDVYMHPDLQRRLLSMVRTRFEQLIIATHSIEIVADVDPSSILSIDRRSDASTFVTTLPGLQEVIDELGGVHNVHVTRLFRARSFLLVEGEDVALMRILQATLSPNAHPIDHVPNRDLKGRGGWATGLPGRIPKRNAEGERITCYCVLDRDYFPDDEVAERYGEARDWAVSLHVWKRKELENYLLVPEAISRFISERTANEVIPPDPPTVSDEIDRIVADMREGVTDDIAAQLLVRDKRSGLKNANLRARAHVDAHWSTCEGRWSISPGKKVISRLSDWSKSTYGVSFGPDQIARTLTAQEIDAELAGVLQAIATASKLPPV